MPDMEKVANQLQLQIAQLAARYEGEKAMTAIQHEEEKTNLQQIINQLQTELNELKGQNVQKETVETKLESADDSNNVSTGPSAKN